VRSWAALNVRLGQAFYKRGMGPSVPHCDLIGDWSNDNKGAMDGGRVSCRLSHPHWATGHINVA
jgi:hypothetical protein